MSENVPDTLSAGLETYRIGPKLRALRQAKGLAEWLRARHVDVPEQLLADPAALVPPARAEDDVA